MSNSRKTRQTPAVTLVTGGDGFIGRALSQRLFALGHDVFVVDNHSTSRPIGEDDGIVRFEENIESIDLSKLPRADFVFHLASMAYPNAFSRTRRELFETNVVATDRLLQRVAAQGGRFVFASTSEVYGMAREAFDEQRGIREDDVCSSRSLSTRSIYPAAKQLGEELVLSARIDGVDAFSIRPFNVYGPGMDRMAGTDARVIPRFLEAARHRRPLPICGDGEQVRSFIWLDDAVQAVAALAHAEELPPVAVNVGHDEPVSIRQLANIVCKLQTIPCRFAFQPSRADEPRWRRPDNRLMVRWSGMRPSVSLREGLGRLLRPVTNGARPDGFLRAGE